MSRHACIVLAVIAVALAGCSPSPNNPVNQTAPIRDMDNFFRSINGSPDQISASAPQPVPDYEHQPGYAPAYPPYDP